MSGPVTPTCAVEAANGSKVSTTKNRRSNVVGKGAILCAQDASGGVGTSSSCDSRLLGACILPLRVKGPGVEQKTRTNTEVIARVINEVA